MNYLMVIVVIIASATALVGCSDPKPTKPADAQALVDHITYVKDKRGICYAVASVHRFSTSGSLTENYMFSAVDCDKAGL